MKFLTNLDLSQNEIQNAVIQPLAAAPANPKLGQIYYNSSDSLLYDYTPIPLSEASCIIAHLFVELALPCSCCNREDNDEIVIQGTTYDGTGAKIIIKGKEVRYYGKQRTLAAIRAGQCRPPALRP